MLTPRGFFNGRGAECAHNLTRADDSVGLTLLFATWRDLMQLL
jgi:hypothetical protein